jgi:CRISPR-associated endonuclease Csn1
MDNTFSYTLGLDIGITSVGWAVLCNNKDGEPFKIERLGVRMFEAAEVPLQKGQRKKNQKSDSGSLAVARREARGSRRVIRRRCHRKERIKQLIATSGIMTKDELAALFSDTHPKGQSEGKCVYELRVEALNRLLTKEETVRLLIHFAQRRGYKSNSKSEEAKNGEETGKVKLAISENERRMQVGGYRTVGEMLWLDECFKRTDPDGRMTLDVHNRPDEYKVSISRDMLADELGKIFKEQRRLGNSWLTEDFEAKYRTIWASQRSFDEGPGGNSPYGGNLIEKMFGPCTLEPGQTQAAKASYTAEYFRLLQFANNLKLAGNGLPAEPLDDDQRKALMDYVMSSPGITYAQLRKKLGLRKDQYFNSLSYGNKTLAAVEKKKLGQMTFYHELRKALDTVAVGAIQTFSPEMLDQIGYILTIFKSDEKRRTALQEAGVDERYIDALLTLSATKTVNLSLAALKKLIPYLEQGDSYYDACKKAGYHSQNTSRSEKLTIRMASDIKNPVVLRAVSQTIKVINAIVREYGQPEVVRIELAREMGKSREERDQIKKQQDKNAEQNNECREQITELKETVSGQDIVKFKLFQEQDGICLYSGSPMEIGRLFEHGYAEIDHIIPYSISLDDSYSNKVLVLKKENQDKGNRIPYDYLGQDEARWQAFETRVDTRIRDRRKKSNLLLKSLSDGQKEGFRQRNLTDTQYITRLVKNLISDNLQFNETGNFKPSMRVQAVNGSITAQVRKRLGLDKNRSNGDLHHAQDAAVIACITPEMVQKITRHAQRQEFSRSQQGYIDYETGEIMTRDAFNAKYAPRFPEPWPQFRQELEARLSDDPAEELRCLRLPTYDDPDEIKSVFVSKMANHKVTGAAHKETIYSGKMDGCIVSKTSLQDLKLDKNGEITGYYQPQDDRLLYNALRERLRSAGGDGKAAFAEPFYKPTRSGKPGPLVKSVKTWKKSNVNVPIRKGLAGNGNMVRLDVFHVEGDGYYYVPIYAADTVKKELPNRAIIAHKTPNEWKIMEDKDFLFSLYPGDLIRVKKNSGFDLNLSEGATGELKRKVTDYFLYYRGINSSTGAFVVTTHDERYRKEGLGGKTLDSIEKYQVDVLGNYTRVPLPEKRRRFR